MEAGFADFDTLRQDPDLAALRGANLDKLLSRCGRVIYLELWGLPEFLGNRWQARPRRVTVVGSCMQFGPAMLVPGLMQNVSDGGHLVECW